MSKSNVIYQLHDFDPSRVVCIKTFTEDRKENRQRTNTRVIIKVNQNGSESDLVFKLPSSYNFGI